MGYLILTLWLLVLPVCTGGLFQLNKGAESGPRLLKKKETASDGNILHNQGADFAVCLLKGQFLLWAVFQLITVPVVLLGGTMDIVLALYLPAGILLGLAGLFLTRRIGMRTAALPCLKKEELILAILFLALWLFQMVNLVTKTAVDADDAYYMTIANIADYNGSLYRINPYSTGGYGLNYRYVLAPYPIWIAFLSRISGLHTLTVGHLVLSTYLVSFSYLIYRQMGKLLFRENRVRLMFLICVCVLNIWGNTSSYTSASFLLIRTRQGKGLVSGIVFPAFVCGLISMGRTLDAGNKCRAGVYILMGCVLLSGCMGSAICGAILLIAWAGIHMMWALAYRQPAVLGKGLLAALPAAVFPVIYMIMG